MNALQSLLATLPCGFLTAETLPKLIALDRLHPVLVRCGGCRFQCAAQDVEHLMKCVDAGGDYVRDLSIPCGWEHRAETWAPESPVTPLKFLPANFLQKPGVTHALRPGHETASGYSQAYDEEYRGDHDGGL